MHKISVIVPVYNVEDYLESCLDSISNQTYSNLEIIVVDDGSPDNSGQIADEYKKKDNRVQVIHQENGGLSVARNSGLEQATGDFVCFIDSDDWIEPDYLELLYTGIQSFNAEISVVKLKKINDLKQLKELTPTKKDWLVFDKHEAMKSLFTNNDIGYSANNKLFKMNLFSDLRFPVGKLMEDKATTYLLIDKSNRIALNSSEKYHYFQSPKSILRGSFNPRKFDTFDIHEDIIIFIDKFYPEVSLNVRSRYVYTAVRMMMSMIENNYSNQKDYDRSMEILSRFEQEAQADPDFSSKLKKLMKFLLKHPSLPYHLSKSKMTASVLNRIESMR
ncbi:glycosyltransferase family 2 protein [Candidatus Enterococcus courvalinii]|uniref:Glycosyltransferase family 2 protein n=1 Tax=Candidatus Enterococcus courvalinii TaxID=2815329 RepID=A0ABS3I2N8_9ENTE|nr:glycosyltransferase family 2 protein [Enterococcus sp. MSG2901]MBO0482978.1 glycosyltransferase family 2 protein [Enterococcus sp. MSG2901]